MITPELLNLLEWDLGPEDALQIDLLLNLPPSGGYENLITALDVFSRYLFAYPVTDASATSTAKVLIEIMTRHTYLPTTLITDKGTAFTSHLDDEITKILGIQIKCATAKHPQAIGKLERTHARENFILRKLNSNKTQILHRIRLRKYTPNDTLQDNRPEGNLQADDKIIIPQDDLYIISWETAFDDFPTFDASKSKSDEYLDDSDQQDAIITDLDLRSNRRDEKTDNAASGQRGNEMSDVDLRSTRQQHVTRSADTEQLPELPDAIMADTDLRSTRSQQDTDSEIVEKSSKSRSKVADPEVADFMILEARI